MEDVVVEWWQAILIGLFPSLITGGVALLVQHRDAVRAADRQDRDLSAEHDKRREEAYRERLRERARGLEDFLDIVEQDQGRRFFKGMMGQGGGRDRAWELVEHAMDQATFDSVWDELVAIDTAPLERWQDVVKRYAGRIVIIGDETLRDSLTKLLMHVAAGEKGALSESEVSTLLLEARSRVDEIIVDPPLRRPLGASNSS